MCDQIIKYFEIRYHNNIEIRKECERMFNEIISDE